MSDVRPPLMVDIEKFQHSEWSITNVSYEAKKVTIFDVEFDTAEYTIFMKRNNKYYLTMGVFPLLIISLIAVLGIFNSDLDSRLNLGITGLLTAVATGYSISSQLPVSETTTWMGHFILTNMLFIGFVCFQASFLILLENLEKLKCTKLCERKLETQASKVVKSGERTLRRASIALNANLHGHSAHTSSPPKDSVNVDVGEKRKEGSQKVIGVVNVRVKAAVENVSSVEGDDHPINGSGNESEKHTDNETIEEEQDSNVLHRRRETKKYSHVVVAVDNICKVVLPIVYISVMVDIFTRIQNFSPIV